MSQRVVHVDVHVDVLIDVAEFERVLARTEFHLDRVAPSCLVPVISPLRHHARTGLLAVHIESSGRALVEGGEISVAVGISDVHIPYS